VVVDGGEQAFLGPVRVVITRDRDCSLFTRSVSIRMMINVVEVKVDMEKQLWKEDFEEFRHMGLYGIRKTAQTIVLRLFHNHQQLVAGHLF
jgi:hypothetical protein